MRIRYDDIEVETTERFDKALIELAASECEMMRLAEPRNAHCWTWGRVIVGDLASTKGLEFEFGGDEDPPGDGLGAFAVIRCT